MLDQLTFDFDNTASGKINKIGTSYSAGIGWDLCDLGQNTAYNFFVGAFFRFDTSSIPDHAEVTVVQFRVRGYRSAPDGDPQFYEARYSIGDIIGGSLDGNAAEWNAGTEVLTLTARPADKTTLTLGSAAPALVDKAGDTDIKILDHGVKGTGDAQWWAFYNKSTTERCRLYVYFTVPSATVTGIGTAALDAAMIYSASATTTGSASATLSATVTHHAGATATGIGDAALAAGLLLASASATASGAGSGELDASVTYSAGGTAIGIGTATLAFYTAPLALDARTISVASSDVATISVVVRDSAEIAVDPDDVATRGPRRAN